MYIIKTFLLLNYEMSTIFIDVFEDLGLVEKQRLCDRNSMEGQERDIKIFAFPAFRNKMRS